MDKNKKLMLIAFVSAALVGGGIFLWWKNRPKKDEEKKDETPILEEPKVETTYTPPKASSSSSSSSSSTTLSATPFKNKTEGDAFRLWMSKKYPNFRYNGDKLDLSGGYDNAFIRKAYQLYGDEYMSSKTSTPSTSTGFKKGDKVYIKGNSVTIRSYPEMDGQWVLGTIPKSVVKDLPFGTWDSSANSTFDKVLISAYLNVNGELVKSTTPKIVYLIKNQISQTAF
jgi:hypothetical protein